MSNYTKSGVKLNGDYLEGYALVWYDPNNPDTEYHISDNLIERISPNCEIDTDPNMRCVIDHDEGNQGFGMTSYLGSLHNRLTIKRDSKGIAYSCKLPTTVAGNDMRAILNDDEGDFRGSSFKFRPNLSDYKITRENGKIIRTFTKLHLEHISPVFDPAYQAATRSFRSDKGDTLEDDDKMKAFLETEKRLKKADSYTK